VEPGETLGAAAEREVAEETGLKVKAGAPIHVFDLIERDEGGSLRFHYVIVDLTAEYLSGEIAPADDARAAGWFAPEAAGDLDLASSTRGLLRKIGFFP
jgi:ADP-ribose pyrophosphatase